MTDILNLRHWQVHLFINAALVASVVFGSHSLRAEVPVTTEDRVRQLEALVIQLQQQVEHLGQRSAAVAEPPPLSAEEVESLRLAAARLDSPRAQRLLAEDSWVQRFTLGGYGELHANFTQGENKDQFDLHRLVLYVGYDFSDWIKFHSEFEVEHAFVSDGKGGYLIVEQAHVDFLLSESFNLRIGRVLTPLGIVNKWHEPTEFNGVERPNFAKYIIPSTWSSDGIGAFGQLGAALSYELYVVGGLDGSGFSAKEGIRGGRLHERPSLNDPAITGRIDYRPVEPLRLGVSGYAGGLNNGNRGANPDISGNIRILSADFDLTLGDFDFRGAVAHQKISDAAGLPTGVGEEMFGWYLEGAYHFWPESWRQGRLANSDALVFVRYDSYDTQYKMPDGVAADKRFDRSDVTVGVGFKPVPNLVLKADYQFLQHQGDGELNNAFNLGVGFVF